MSKTISITTDDQTHEKAKQISKEILGKQNVSGLFTYLIHNYDKEK